jgi:uncharacterized protein YcaQ
MSTIHIDIANARSLHLAAQGLLKPPQRKAKKADVLSAIQRMALLQIDTISVVARSPYLVLWSRLGHYDMQWLEAHLSEGALFEYWAHEACFVPTEDFRLLRHRMLDPSSMGWKHSEDWIKTHKSDINKLLKHVAINGPVQSKDFVRATGTKGSGWWDWKPEKRHLEALFTTGKLMVAERRSFQRVYDITERVLPHWNDARDLPTLAQARLEMIRKSCRALGVVKPQWVADYYRLKHSGRSKADSVLYELADAGELIPVRIDGDADDAFVHSEHQNLLELAVRGQLNATVTTLLSPFDPVVWDRKRAFDLFDFDYRIECYTPAPKRIYGYFVLPILSRGKIVGRLDAKAHRALGVFEIKALYLEPNVSTTKRLAADIHGAISRCASWHGCTEVKLCSMPRELKRLMNSHG